MSEDQKQRLNLLRERRALLELRLKDKRRGAGRGQQQQEISRDAGADVYPLSFEQERLWFLHLLDPSSLMHHLNRVMTLVGPLDTRALQKSFDEVVRRHEILRTTIVFEDGRPVQRVAPPRPDTLPLVDLLELPPGEREAQATRLMTQQAREPFNAAEGPLMRAALLRVGDEKHMLLLTAHHVITDWWSFGVLYRELATLYRAFSGGATSPLTELPIQYGDFARWQRERLQGTELETLLSYWKRQLSGAPHLLSLPADRARASEQTYRGRRFCFQLPKELYQKLNDVSRAEDVTTFVIMLAVFQVLLYRYTAQEDILVGTPSANRSRRETEGLIGFLLNTLVLRGNLSGEPTFRELLGRLRRTILDAYAHQDLPFQKLVEEVHTERNLGAMPLVQVCFIFLSTQLPNLEAIFPKSDVPDFAGLQVQWTNVKSIASEFDLTLGLENRPDYFDAFFEYNTDLFEEATISRMAGHLRTLMEAVVVNPDRRISDLPLLTEEERDALLINTDAGAVSAPPSRHIHQSFEAQAEKTPDATAIIFEDEAVSYRELNERANRLAHHLRQLGVGRETLVGVLLERSVGMIVGLLAILKAGGAYLPLDPSYPAARLALMLADARAPFMLTRKGLGEGLSARGVNVVYVDAMGEDGARQSGVNPVSTVVSDNLAYVIYTSGSTGRPKGVQITHGSLSNFLHAMQQSLDLTPEDVVLAVSTICFDISTLEIFLPLITGARLVLVDREAAADGEQLLSIINRQGVTLAQATPTTWQMMLEVGWARGRRLKILSGGEALPPKVAAQLLERSTWLWNLYGPTETTVWVSGTRLAAEHETHHIGRAIANAQIYVLDGRLQPVPAGVAGEIYVAGAGVARGYLNAPAMTAERFIANPLSDVPGSRLYRTGDLARYLPDGRIEFLGRADYQVKVRGHRVELGEIEAVLHAHPAVRQTVVLTDEDEQGQRRLIAYLVEDRQADGLAAAGQLTTSMLHRYLRDRLPEYMIPSAFIMLEALPLKINGKLDRESLPRPDQARPKLEDAYQAARTPVEHALVDLWARILKLERVGIHDNFFELGGDSLISIQVIAEARQIGLNFVPKQIFNHQTIAELAEVAERIPAAAASAAHRGQTQSNESQTAGEWPDPDVPTAAGDVPGNFPAAKLSQKELDAFLSRLGRTDKG
jgi:amino acid adenylation domain-containing protein